MPNSKISEFSYNGNTYDFKDKDAQYTDIDYEDWLELTPTQQVSGNYDVHNVPNIDGTIKVDLMTKLWENPSPTSAFARQDITLASDDYDVLLIIGNYINEASGNVSNIIKKGETGYLTFAGFISGTSTNMYRGFVYTDDTHYTVYNCSKNGGSDNSFLIPIVIYGIKASQTIKIKAIATDVNTSADHCMLSDGETSVEDRLTANEISDSTRITIEVDTDYTTLSDGYFKISAPAGSNYCVGRINGVNMAVAVATSYSAGQISIFVRKGAVLHFIGSSGCTGSFYPLS